MTYRDFGPAMNIIAIAAPQLLSLAIHGLYLPDQPFEGLAVGCPRLRRLHLVGCEYTVHGLEAFLRAAHSLAHLDLSGGEAPRRPHCAYAACKQSVGCEGRDDSGPPSRREECHRSGTYIGEGGWVLVAGRVGIRSFDLFFRRDFPDFFFGATL